MAQEKPGKKVIAQNREAHHEYFVIEALETGVELVGTEVKSLRAGGVNLKDSWADIDDGEIILKGMHISPYEQGNIFNKDPAAPAACWRIKARFAIAAADQTAGVHTGAAPTVFQAGACKSGTGPVQRQKAVR